ncbi:uncharacterized protein LY89DRAFT_735007 [Mollisia scopiformis]|uniref:Uncharacterized protein n=1 Tax=Mollisia scopiformis TaxID=149040 RepID=A0A194X6R1_MOLSC|nr:uncharacterized protein LY89DRAFT_735007 [Mollisia scopiformis]KUJ15861.1 hypothetical protein LY89DRAFT_735007 [Mollisia scopiformis]
MSSSVLAKSPDGIYDGRGAWIYDFVAEGQTCPSNSDIAGIGVVISSVLCSLYTALASILLAGLDARYGKSTTRYARCRHLLVTSVTVLADAQAFMGLALLTAAYLNLTQYQNANASVLDFQDAHFTLAGREFDDALSPTSSHLASLLVLSLDRYKMTTLIRVGVIISFAVFLTITIDVSEYAFEPAFIMMERVLIDYLHFSKGSENILEYFAPPMAMAWIFWISVAQLLEPWKDCWLRKPARLRRQRYWQLARLAKAVIRFLVFGHPLAVLLLQVCFAGVSVACALLQKFTPAPSPTTSDIAKGVGQWCSLNNAQDNAWGFGQTSALIVLIIPVYSTVHEFLDSNRERHAHPEQELEEAKICKCLWQTSTTSTASSHGQNSIV